MKVKKNTWNHYANLCRRKQLFKNQKIWEIVLKVLWMKVFDFEVKGLQ